MERERERERERVHRTAECSKVVLKTNKNLAVTTFNKPAIFSRGKDLIRSF
jgi:hypothetical protein